MLDQPLGRDAGHGIVGVMDALAAGEAQREGQAFLDLTRARGSETELVVVAHDRAVAGPWTGKEVVCSAMSGISLPEHKQNILAGGRGQVPDPMFSG